MSDTSEETKTEQKEETLADELEILEPKYEPNIIILREELEGGDTIERVYEQHPLGALQKWEFTALLSKAIDEAMTGPNSLSVGQVVALVPEAMDADNIGADTIKGMLDQIGDVDAFVQGFMRLAQYVPDLMNDSICIWLAIPKFEREWAKQVMSKPPALGGLSDDAFQNLMDTFIDQNTEALRDFFTGRLRKTLTRVKARWNRNASVDSDSSTPSRRSRQTAPKR